MANLSSAEVEITVEKVGKEFLDYVKATNEQAGDYVIVYDGFSEELDENGDLHIVGSSSGRWAYSNNLEGYFDQNRVKDWLGVNSDYAWLKDEAKKKEYLEQSNKQYGAYLKLVEAIKEKNGRVEINYTDCDPAMDWMGSGGAVLELQDGEVTFSHGFDEESLDVTAYAEMNDISITEAFEVVHGEEPAEKWSEYVKECEKKGEEPKDPQVWYDEDFEWED